MSLRKRLPEIVGTERLVSEVVRQRIPGLRYSNCGKKGFRMIRMSSWMMWVMFCFMHFTMYCVAVLIRGSRFLRTCLCTATGLLSLLSVQTTRTGLLSTAHGTSSRWKTIGWYQNVLSSRYYNSEQTVTDIKRSLLNNVH